MLIPANVVPAVRSLFVLSCDAPLGKVRVAVPLVVGGSPPDQFAPSLQLLSPPRPVQVQAVQSTATDGDAAIAVSVPPDVDFARVVNVLEPVLDGAVAPDVPPPEP